MPAARTTDTLLADVRATIQLPDAEGRLTTAEIYRLCDQAMVLAVADVLGQPRAQRSATIQGTGITAGQQLYRIPDRALAAGTWDVLITDGTVQYSAPEIPADEAWRYAVSAGAWDSPYAYCWRDDSIALLPPPAAGGASLSLVWVYPLQPSRFVAVSACAVVSSSTPTVITTTATVPSTWASSETLDIVRAQTGIPWRFTDGTPTLDLAGTSISGTSITVSGGLPSDLPAGSYVCLDGETCVPPVPESVWPVLVAQSALLVAQALTDPEKIAVALQALETAVRVARKLLEPRNKGAVQRRTPAYTPLRVARGWVR